MLKAGLSSAGFVEFSLGSRAPWTAEIETPKASRVKGMGRGYPLPNG